MAFRIGVSVKGLRGSMKYVVRTPKYVDKEAKFARKELALFIQRSARTRASRGWSGNLAQSIVVRPNKSSISVIVGARYGRYVEEGRHPKVIPIEYLEQHMSSPGARGVDTRDLGMKPRAWIFPKPAQPFMAPAIEAGLSNLPNLIERTIIKAIYG